MILFMVIATIGFVFGMITGQFYFSQFKDDLSTVLAETVRDMEIDREEFMHTFTKKVTEFKAKKR